MSGLSITALVVATVVVVGAVVGVVVVAVDVDDVWPALY